MSQGIPSGEREKYRIRCCFHSVFFFFYIAQIRSPVFYILWLVLQGKEIQANYSLQPSHLTCHIFISGCPVARGSHSLFVRAPEGTWPCTGGLKHQAVILLWHVCSCSLSPCTASLAYFSLFPEKKSICPPSHILSCLPTAPHCPKGGGFFCVDWLCLVSLQSLLCALLLWEAPSASHWLCLLQPNGVCRPSTPHYIHPSPINDTSHIDPKKQRVFTRPRAQTACGFLFNKATAALGNHS